MLSDVLFFVFFFFKQKTAYEMRISDWSSDVCSSDLDHEHREVRSELAHQGLVQAQGQEPPRDERDPGKRVREAVAHAQRLGQRDEADDGDRDAEQDRKSVG